MNDVKKIKLVRSEGKAEPSARRKKNGAVKESREKTYLQRKMWLNAVNTGLRIAAAETMQILKYNVIAEDGWVVKVYTDGTKEKLKAIPLVTRPLMINLK